MILVTWVNSAIKMCKACSGDMEKGILPWLGGLEKGENISILLELFERWISGVLGR